MADLFAKYNCTYCQEDITGLRVRCSVCPDFELCLQCFSYGAESGPHKNDHPYRFMDSGTIGVFSGRGVWSAREEMRLLDAVEQYGFGNWEDISRHIETRNPDEAKEEYVARYLEGNIGRLTWPASAGSRPTLSDTTAPDSGPLAPNVTARLPPLDASAEEAGQLGYMPQRDDFETEFDNDAETLVSPLCVNSIEDEDIHIALKLSYVDMYTRRLRERARRKRLCRDYQLVSNYFTTTRRDRPSTKKKPSKYERELRDKFRVFAQFYTAQEHESLVRNLVRQDELSRRVRELERYRRGGVTRFEECTHFEQQRARHEHIRDKIAQWVHPLSSLNGNKKRRKKKRRKLLFQRKKMHTKLVVRQLAPR